MHARAVCGDRFVHDAGALRRAPVVGAEVLLDKFKRFSFHFAGHDHHAVLRVVRIVAVLHEHTRLQRFEIVF